MAAALRRWADDLDKKRISFVRGQIDRPEIEDHSAPMDGCRHFVAGPFTTVTFVFQHSANAKALKTSKK